MTTFLSSVMRKLTAMAPEKDIVLDAKSTLECLLAQIPTQTAILAINSNKPARPNPNPGHNPSFNPNPNPSATSAPSSSSGKCSAPPSAGNDESSRAGDTEPSSSSPPQDPNPTPSPAPTSFPTPIQERETDPALGVSLAITLSRQLHSIKAILYGVPDKTLQPHPGHSLNSGGSSAQSTASAPTPNPNLNEDDKSREVSKSLIVNGLMRQVDLPLALTLTLVLTLAPTPALAQIVTVPVILPLDR